MQLQTSSCLENSTCVDGSSLADRYAFCEVLHRDMDVSRIDFISNVRHLIAVYEGIDRLLVPKDFVS